MFSALPHCWDFRANGSESPIVVRVGKFPQLPKNRDLVTCCTHQEPDELYGNQHENEDEQAKYRTEPFVAAVVEQCFIKEVILVSHDSIPSYWIGDKIQSVVLAA